jgi:hypothetical protein
LGTQWKKDLIRARARKYFPRIHYTQYFNETEEVFFIHRPPLSNEKPKKA